MAEPKLGKTVRTNYTKYDPAGSKLEVWTKSRHKYLVLSEDSTGINAPKTSTIQYINSEKISASLTDDEVINTYLDRNKVIVSQDPINRKLPTEVTQDPYVEPAQRIYGEFPYWINKNSILLIDWLDSNGTKVTSNEDNADKLLNTDGTKKIINKTVKLISESYIADDYKFFFGYILCVRTNGDIFFEYRVDLDEAEKKKNETGIKKATFPAEKSDKEIIEFVLERLKNITKYQPDCDEKVIKSLENVKLCDPDTKSCSSDVLRDFLKKKTTNKTTESSAKSDESKLNPTPVSDTKIPIYVDSLFINSADNQVLEIQTKSDFALTVIVGKSEDVSVGDGEDLDEEFQEVEQGEGENLQESIPASVVEYDEKQYQEDIKNGTLSPEKVESASEVGGKHTVPSNSDGTVSGLLASSPVTTKEQAGKYASAMVPPCFNGVPIYAQNHDPRWKSKPYDNRNNPKAPNFNNAKSCEGSTVGSSGCGPTSMSMAVNFWANKGKCKFTGPSEMAVVFERNFQRVCGSGSGINGNLKKALREIFGLELEVGISNDKVEKCLRAGIPVVIAGSNFDGLNILGQPSASRYTGGHFVCLTGIDSSGRVRVNDPGGSANSASEKNPRGGAITYFTSSRFEKHLASVSQRVVVYPSSNPPPA